MASLQIAFNAITAKVIDPPKDVRIHLSNLLSYEVKDNNGSGPTWTGRSTFYVSKNNTFPAGFVNFVYNDLTRKGHKIQLLRNKLPAPLGPENPVVDSFPYDPKYDYQMETVNKLLKYGRMIAQVATGGGKSRIAKLTYSRIQRPTLFLTTRGVLMYQMKESFEDTMDIDVGIMGDNAWSPSDGFNVAMVQTLASYTEQKLPEYEIDRFLSQQQKEIDQKLQSLRQRLIRSKKMSMAEINRTTTQKRNELLDLALSHDEICNQIYTKCQSHNERRDKVIELLNRFEVVILEEAHEAGGNSYYEILNHCKKAYYRLALTATPFMRDDEEANMRLMAASGSIGIKVTEKDLIDRGILATPKFKFITVTDHPPEVRKSTAYQAAYTHGIVENESRNKLIAQEAITAVSHGLPVLILVKQKKHGTAIKELISQSISEVEFIYGDHKQDVRKKMLTALQHGELKVLIGSTILDVGVDVPAVGMVILAGSGKAEVGHRQRIGRGLRAKRSGPNICFVVDFIDVFNKHLLKHSKQRKAIINETNGFKQNVLKENVDFDYSIYNIA